LVEFLYMTIDDLKNIVKDIVGKANNLKRKITVEEAPINYACIFCQNEKEYNLFFEITKQMGVVVQETETGSVFQISPLSTVAGTLKLLKIRKPDSTRSERGDADFTLSNYKQFKEKNLSKSGFKLVQREKFEMIEYLEPGGNARIYFSNPTLAEILNIK